MPVIDSTERDVFAVELRRVIRYAGLLMPFLVVIIGIAIKFGLFTSDYYHSDLVFALLALALILVGIWQYINDIRVGNTGKVRVVLLIIYHLLSAAFLLFVFGLNNPVILLWLIILVASDIFFGRKALYASSVTLFSVWAIFVALYPNMGLQNMLEALGAICIVIIAGVIVSELRIVNDTERRTLDRLRNQESIQRDRLLTLINGIGDSFISTNSKGIIKVYNAATLSLLDTNKSLIGQSLNSVLNLYDEDDHRVNIMKLLKESNSVVTRTDLVHKFDDGEQINLYINMAPIRPSFQQKTQNGFILVMRDITREKSLEEERDEFISVVSHELRTPVTVAEGNLSNIKIVLQRGGDKSVMDKAVATAHEQILYLAKMINDLSTLSRAERGIADEPEEINVLQLVQDLYNKYLSGAQEKGLKLNLDTSTQLGVVSASRLYLEETLQNFITNAIKYTKEGSVTIGAHKQGDEVEFSVSDTGIGISKADQKHVFEKFFRSEDYRTRETSGTGLGLYIVRKLSHKLKIHVEFESRLNHGSSFKFKMPLKTP